MNTEYSKLTVIYRTKRARVSPNLKIVEKVFNGNLQIMVNKNLKYAKQIKPPGVFLLKIR